MTLPKANRMTPTTCMTLEQAEQLRQDLLRSLSRLERSTKSNGSGLGNLDQTCIGRLSRIEALQNRGLTQGLKERERIHLEQVLDALCRLEKGTYGICDSCQIPIPYERLLVFPETRTCTPCG
jgi:DnaK suppressor protein